MTEPAGRLSGLTEVMVDVKVDATPPLRSLLDRLRAGADARSYLVARCCFIGSWLTLSWPWLSGRVTIPYDAKGHFQAQLQFLANALHSGQSPFWNPHVFVGTPHIADPQSLIFTPAYLIALFSPDPPLWMLDAYALALLLAAGLATIALAADRGWHPACALLAAMAIAFGGPAAWRIQHIGQIQSFAFFIIAVWLLQRALARSSMLWGLLAGVGIGCMMASPNQVSFLAAYTLAGFVVAHWLLADNLQATFKRSIVPLMCAATIAIAIAAVPLVLVVLYGSSSNRPAIAFAEVVRGSLHPASLLTAVVGDLFGALDPTVDYWGPYSERWDPNELTLSQNMSQLYIGALPILMLTTVAFSRAKAGLRAVRAEAIMAVLLLAYALGGYSPLFRLMYDWIPGVAQFRRPVDATFLLSALMALLAGHVLNAWLTRDRNSGRERGMLIIPAALVVVATLVAVHENALNLAWQPIVKAVLWLGVAGGVAVGLRGRAVASPALATLVMAGLMAADLSVNNGPNDSTALRPALYDMLSPTSRNATLVNLREHVKQAVGSDRRDRIEVVGVGFSWQNAAMTQGMDQTLGYNPLRMAIVADALGARDYIAGPDQRVFSPLFPSYRSTLADLLGLRFVVSSVPLTSVDKHLGPEDLQLVASTSQAFIYENTQALPRVMMVPKALPVDFARLVKTGVWPAFNPMRTVLLDRSDAAWRSGVGQQAWADGSASAAIRRYENTLVEVEVVAPHAGFLVLGDLWHPWWTAAIDGKPVAILKANVMFRSVQVPAGRHLVRFEFHPMSGAWKEICDRIATCSGRKIQVRLPH